MVRPSNPRLMARVLNAVASLGDSKGSSAREVLSFIKQSNISSKNLTLQIHRALKHAVNAGLLRHRSGRYKTLATLNPNPVSDPPTAKETIINNQKDEEKKSEPVQVPNSEGKSSRRKQKKKASSRRRNSRHRSKGRKRSRRSPYARRSKTPYRRKRKRTYEDEELEDQSSCQYILHRRNDSPVPFNHRTKRSRVLKRELKSDFSEESDRDSNVNRKRISRTSRRKPKRKKTRAKSRGRSTSRARSPQRQQSTEKVEDDRQQCDEDHGSIECNVAHQEAHKDIERIHEPNVSNSGSTLENSRD